MINNRFRFKCPKCGIACWEFRNNLACRKTDRAYQRKRRAISRKKAET